MERYRQFEQHNLICFFTNYSRNKILLQLNTDDVTRMIFFKAGRKNAKTRFLLKNFLSLLR